MKSFEFYKANGRVDNTEAIHAWLDRQLRYVTNGHHQLSLTRKIRHRSLAQNRLMWLWFACMEHETGQPAMDFHDHYCMKYLAHDFTNPATGDIERVGGHTSTLSKDAFANFLNNVQADAAEEFGITLPSPNDEMWAEFVQEYEQFIS